MRREGIEPSTYSYSQTENVGVDGLTPGMRTGTTGEMSNGGPPNAAQSSKRTTSGTASTSLTRTTPPASLVGSGEMGKADPLARILERRAGEAMRRGHLQIDCTISLAREIAATLRGER